MDKIETYSAATAPLADSGKFQGYSTITRHGAGESAEITWTYDTLFDTPLEATIHAMRQTAARLENGDV